MSDTSRNSNSATATILGIVVVLPIIYVLSIGPVLYATTRFLTPISSHSHLATFYAPVIWLHENTSLKQPLDSYVGWWDRRP